MEESRMTATQTMEVVYGLFKNMKVVMDGTQTLPDIIFIVLKTCSFRWKGVDRQYPRGPWYDKVVSVSEYS